MHPVLKKVMAGYHKSHSTVINLTKIIKAAGIDMANIPYLNRYKKNDRDKNRMCYYHLLGCCPHKDCARVHVPKAELGDGFLAPICNCLEMGFAGLCKEAKSPSTNSPKKGKLCKKGKK